VNDETAAALPNPGVSAWLSLTYRAKLVRDENVLILGATGVTGKLAVKIARLLGAARVVAAGRNQQALNTLPDLGVDATIWLAPSETELSEAFVREGGQSGFQVVIDYVWGHPSITVSALSRDTSSSEGILGFDFPFVEGFDFGVAFDLCSFDQGPLSESRGGTWFHQPSIRSLDSDHDSLFRLPNCSGRQGAQSAQR